MAATAPDDPAATPRLLVVDADDRTRESIVGLLGIRHRFDVVGSAGMPAPPSRSSASTGRTSSSSTHAFPS